MMISDGNMKKIKKRYHVLLDDQSPFAFPTPQKEKRMRESITLWSGCPFDTFLISIFNFISKDNQINTNCVTLHIDLVVTFKLKSVCFTLKYYFYIV